MTSLADLVTTELSEDLRWREEELALMRKQLVVSKPNSLQERVLLRATLAMIYAHYEGFCKFALEAYLEALDKLGMKRKDLKWPLAMHSMKPLHKELLAQSDSVNFFTHFIKEFDKHLEQPAKYERPPRNSNLWPDLLEDLLTKLDLSAEYVKSERTLLESLVNNRNQIAHGKKLVISSRAILDQYSNAAQLAMHEVALGVADSLERESYRRHSTVHTILGHSI